MKSNHEEATPVTQSRLTEMLGLVAIILYRLFSWRLNMSTGRVVKEVVAVHTAPAGNFVFKWSDDFCCPALRAISKRREAADPCSSRYIPSEPRTQKEQE